jgi:hypothetical protein
MGSRGIRMGSKLNYTLYKKMERISVTEDNVS